ncbi:MAG: hypothetical protein JWP59_3234 [Massilia sp.]|nr:hypothetical protein [Massilia sp.]
MKKSACLWGAVLALAACGDKGGPKLPASASATLRTDMFQAAASNGRLAVAVGGAAVVVTTVPGALQTRQVLPGTVALIDVASCANGSFAALDFYRAVWVADAAASKWSAHKLAGGWRPLAITCDPQNRLWVVGSGTTVTSSADGGATWQQRDFKEDAMFNTVQFVDAEHGFITGEFGKILRTADGGASWQAAPAIAEDFYPYAALFTSEREGYVAGPEGAMLHTHDAGQSWSALENPGRAPQFGLARANKDIYAVGMGGAIKRLDGKRWVNLDHGPHAPALLRAIAPAGKDSLLVGGAMGVIALVPADARAANDQP